jgi:hypothetical protein
LIENFAATYKKHVLCGCTNAAPAPRESEPRRLMCTASSYGQLCVPVQTPECLKLHMTNNTSHNASMALIHSHIRPVPTSRGCAVIMLDICPHFFFAGKYMPILDLRRDCAVLKFDLRRDCTVLEFDLCCQNGRNRFTKQNIEQMIKYH